MKKALVFGAGGGIGSAVVQQLSKDYEIIAVSTKQVDFTQSQCYNQVKELLRTNDPAVVVNCVGHFSTNNETHYQVFDINLGSNWAIIKHYTEHTDKQVRIIMVGSSSYREGKERYMLYSASKAALYNLWQGAVKFFADTNIAVDLVNPVRTLTKMTADKFDPTLDYLDPHDVADEISLLIAEDIGSRCRDINFKEQV